MALEECLLDQIIMALFLLTREVVEVTMIITLIIITIIIIIIIIPIIIVILEDFIISSRETTKISLRLLITKRSHISAIDKFERDNTFKRKRKEN